MKLMQRTLRHGRQPIMQSTMPDPVEVAVGILLKSDGHFLLGQRPAGKPYAGYWEFPGGKLETGEDVFTALQRELHEELGLEIHTAAPWVTRVFVYPHATVRLHFWRVQEKNGGWSGVPHGRENQAFGWFDLQHLQAAAPLLPATLPVLRWLALPPFYAISAATQLGKSEFLKRLRARVAANNLPLLQLREKELPPEQFDVLFREVRAIIADSNTQLMINSFHPQQYWEHVDGVHLSAADLLQWQQRPPFKRVAASCHTRAELEHAAQLECDFAVLGNVNPTRSHPKQTALGWPQWQALTQHSALPVYAIGGLQEDDLSTAEQHGAHGLAMISGLWNLA